MKKDKTKQKVEKWDRSDILSAISLIISLIAIVLSSYFSFFAIQTEFGEDITIEVLPNDQHFIHVSTLYTSKETGPMVTKIASWYEIRISNRSNQAISLVEFYYQEDEQLRDPLPTPFAKSILYKDNAVIVGDYLELPIRLDSNESIKIFALLPTSVPEEIGKLLVPFMRNGDTVIDTDVETILFTPDFFEVYEESIKESYKENPYSDFIDLTSIDVSEITLTRPLIRQTENGFEFIDSAPNKDGFIFRDEIDLPMIVAEKVFESDTLTFEIEKPSFTNYHITIQAGTGNYYEYILRSGKSAYNSLIP